jgi:hypothetical protein
MIHLEKIIRIEAPGSNVLIKGKCIYFYEQNKIRALAGYEEKWSYEFEIKPYLIYLFNSNILFQRGDGQEITVLNDEGGLQSKVPGYKTLFFSMQVYDSLLLMGGEDKNDHLLKMDESFAVAATKFKVNIGNIRFYDGYLFDMFEGIRCWDFERQELIWEKDVADYCKFMQFSTELAGNVRDLYFDKGVVIAAFHCWLVGMDINTGEIIWERKFEASGFYQWGFVENGILYVYAHSGYFRKIAVRTGEVIREEKNTLTCINPANQRQANLADFHLTNVVNTPRFFVGCTKVHDFIYLVDKQNFSLAYMGRLVEDFPEIYAPIQYVDGLLYVQLRYKEYQELRIYRVAE